MTIESGIELGVKLVAIIGGVIAAFKVIYELKETRKLQSRELRWKQSNSARELLKDLNNSKFAYYATIMIDYSGRNFNIDDNQSFDVNFEDIRRSLRTNLLQFSEKELFIRDCFDNFLFHIEIIEQAIKNQLIEFKDIKFPTEYYNKLLLKNNLREELFQFMNEYTYSNAIDFFKRFDNE